MDQNARQAALRLQSIEDFAIFADVGSTTVRRLVLGGKLPAIKVGRQYRIDVQAALEALALKPAEPEVTQ